MSQELRVFSPSSTETFAFCPRKWSLRREGWRPRVIDYPELCAVLGDGFSASMQVLNTFKMQGVSALPMAEIVRAGTDTMSRRLQADQDAGRVIHEKDREFADLLPVKLDQAVNLYITQYPLKDWRILSAEQTFEQHGYARIDLIAEDAYGPAVFDYKVKVRFNPAWEAETFAQYGRSQQRFHYQWATGVKRFFIILVVLEISPKSAKGKPYVKLSAPFGESPYFENGTWLADSSTLWDSMAEVKAVKNVVPNAMIPGSVIHADKFGECEYADACLHNGLDPRVMAVQYVNVKTERSE